MPHTNRKKKTSADANKPTTKPTIVHTKRKEVQDDDGWTHVVDTPRSRRGTVSKSAISGLHAGDFEVKGVSYVNKTLEEMKADFEFWKKGWEDSEACRILKDRLLGRNETQQVVAAAESEENIPLVGEESPEKSNTETHEETHEGENAAANIEVPAAVEADVDAMKPSERAKVDNVVILGLGSLQSARREGRRASATQLAALQTIINTLGDERDIKILLQEPQFTSLDKEFLISFGYEVVEDPDAFSKITETSLVYAIHCYAQVYKSVSEATRPAMLIGTDIDNFWKFNLSETAEAIQKSLEEMVKDCDVFDFPQLRQDFSDTKIYWRNTSSTTP